VGSRSRLPRPRGLPDQIRLTVTIEVGQASAVFDRRPGEAPLKAPSPASTPPPDAGAGIDPDRREGPISLGGLERRSKSIPRWVAREPPRSAPPDAPRLRSGKNLAPREVPWRTRGGSPSRAESRRPPVTPATDEGWRSGPPPNHRAVRREVDRRPRTSPVCVRMAIANRAHRSELSSSGSGRSPEQANVPRAPSSSVAVVVNRVRGPAAGANSVADPSLHLALPPSGRYRASQHLPWGGAVGPQASARREVESRSRAAPDAELRPSHDVTMCAGCSRIAMVDGGWPSRSGEPFGQECCPGALSRKPSIEFEPEKPEVEHAEAGPVAGGARLVLAAGTRGRQGSRRSNASGAAPPRPEPAGNLL